MKDNEIYQTLISEILNFYKSTDDWTYVDKIYYKYPNINKRNSDCDIVFICNGKSLLDCKKLIVDFKKIIIKIDSDDSIFVYPTFRLQNLNIIVNKKNLLHLSIYYSIDSLVCYDDAFLLKNIKTYFNCLVDRKLSITMDRSYLKEERILYRLFQIWIETTFINEFKFLNTKYSNIECSSKYKYIIRVIQTIDSTNLSYDNLTIFENMSINELSGISLKLLEKTLEKYYE